MARLIIPETAFKSKDNKKGKWHLKAPIIPKNHVGYYETPACQFRVSLNNRIEKFIDEIPHDQICKVCLGGFVATPSDEKYAIITIEDGYARYDSSTHLSPTNDVDLADLTAIVDAHWNYELECHEEIRKLLRDNKDKRGAAYAKIKVINPVPLFDYDYFNNESDCYIEYDRVVVLVCIMEYPEDE